jgi:hypothetical protein
MRYADITGFKISKTFTPILQSGYPARLAPTDYMIKVKGSRLWHRVRVICFSNVGSLYIRTKTGLTCVDDTILQEWKAMFTGSL